MATIAAKSTSIRSKSFVHQHCQRRPVQIAGPGAPAFARGRLLPFRLVCPMQQVRGELQDSALRHALAAVANAEAGASSLPEPGRFTSSAEEQKLADRTVMCYGIPWSMEPDEAETWLNRQCSVLKDEITHIQLRRFGDDKALQAQYPENSKHTGYAHIALRSSESVSTLVDVISEQELDGRALKALPASDTRKLLPPGWFDTIGYLEGGEEWVQEQERLKAERERKHADQVRHNRNRRRRRKEQHADGVKEVVQKLINPFTGKGLSEPSHVTLDTSAEPGDGSGRGGEAAVDWSAVWDEMPAPCDPARGGRLCKASMAAASVQPVPMRKRSSVKQQKRMASAAASGGGAGPIRLGGVSARAERKRVQVASFAVVLRQILGGWRGEEGAKAAMIVDFGCGSGNLLLPLAALFPKCTFIGVDMKKVSVELLNERAKDSGLGNVSGIVGSIEEYDGDFDVALGLHACGMATDHAMDKAMARSAAYVMCPCCVGKLKFGLQGHGGAVVMTNAPNGGGDESDTSGDGAEECARGGPRSSWLRESIDLEEFATLATAADLSHADGHGYYEWAEQAKTCIELDRNKAAQDSSYQTALTKLLGVDKDHFVNKSDILVGAPKAKIASDDFKWPWEL